MRLQISECRFGRLMDSQLNLGDGNYMPRKQQIPSYAGHNAHMYYLILPSQKERDEFINLMKQKEIHCVFHYVPLHLTSNTNLNFKKTGMLSNTEKWLQDWCGYPFGWVLNST